MELQNLLTRLENRSQDRPNYQSSTFPEPRPFQSTAHQSLRDGAKAGHRCQMLMAPTGAGKTFLGLRVAHEALQRGKRAIFVCDRTTLINQTSERADEYGLSAHGVLQASHWRCNMAMPFQIASAQTLARRQWPDADVIIIDEAHTQMKVWTDHIQTTAAHVVGLSATPFSRGLGKLFTNLVNATTAHALTELGTLVPMRVFSCTRPDMKGAETSGGEWTDNAAADRGMKIVGDVVTEWVKLAEGRKTIIFGATIAHCEELCAQFNAAGVEAALFTSNTTDVERAGLLREYRKHNSTLRILVSVEALAKGFDVPDVECICDARPLRKSLSTAIQMWGRGLRSSPDTAKKDCYLLDFSGNILRFAEDYTEIFYNGLSALDAGEKLDKAIRDEDEKDVKGCPSCGAIPFAKKCMACGYEMRKVSMVEAVAGELSEIFIGKSKTGFSKEAIWQQVCAYARAHSAPEKQQGRAAHLYCDIVGSFPPRFWKVDSTVGVPISREILNKIRSKNIAYAAAMKRR